MCRVYCFLFLLISATACKQPGRKSDVARSNPAPINTVRDTGDQILKILESGDLLTFSNHISEQIPLSFSPYVYADHTIHKQLTRAEFTDALSKNWILTWGQYDGTGEPIKLTVREYFEKFVVDKKYSRADSVLINKVTGRGNSVNNLTTAFPDTEFVGYYVNGTEKYAKMDWSGLYLVFKKSGNNFQLIAIIHDQWTI